MIRAINKTGRFNLKERVLLKKILEEQELGMTGVIDQDLTAEIGKVYGVKGIITGSVLKWEDVISVTARLIHTETGSILKTAEIKTIHSRDIPDRIDELAIDIAGITQAHSEDVLFKPGVYYQIINKDSQKCLDVERGGVDAGNNIWIFDKNRTGAQLWRYDHVDGDYYLIVNQRSQKCLDVEYGCTEAGINVWQWDRNKSGVQLWRLIEIHR
jgi:hypothetical protein